MEQLETDGDEVAADFQFFPLRAVAFSRPPRWWDRRLQLHPEGHLQPLGLRHLGIHQAYRRAFHQLPTKKRSNSQQLL